MDNKNLVEIIINEAKEVVALTQKMQQINPLPEVYIDLALSKVKNLYLQLQLLNKDIGETAILQRNEILPKSAVINKPIDDKFAEIMADSEPKFETNQAIAVIEAVQPIKQTQQTANIERIVATEPIIKAKNEPTAKVQSNEQQTSILADKFKSNEKTLNELIGKQSRKRSLASQFSIKPITDLRTAISINNKIRFIKELFDNDAQKYNLMIETLNKQTNLDEAIHILATSFYFPEDNQTYIEFLELIYRRFAE